MTKYFDGMGKDVTAYVVKLEEDKQSLGAKLNEANRTIQRLSKTPHVTNR